MDQINKLVATITILSSALLLAKEFEFHYRRAKLQPIISVYITGEVKTPGTVTLPLGARRIHALEYCGGVTARAELENLDPAKPLVDGETIHVEKQPARGAEPSIAAVREDSFSPEKSSSPAKKEKNPGKVEINTATAQEFQRVPGIGPSLAQRIVEARNLRPSGSFNSIEDLTTIRGIKGKTMARLQPYLELEGQ